MSVMSEAALARDWLRPEEDEAWRICKGAVVVVPFPFLISRKAKDALH
jgi:hypothetical protein